LLKEAGVAQAIMVDCSHGNSEKRHERQTEVLSSILSSRAKGCREMVGFMVESNLVAGRQDIPDDLSDLVYGMSVTDACVGWDSTLTMLRSAFDRHRLD
jgi:3-deoxy-7-phosphoheptulonate synthase